jgi:cysteine desulfurase
VPSIYVDHAATTPLSPAAFKAITAQLQELGNPSSLHTHGRATRKSLEDAREAIAREVGSLASEVIFTASGTEANNIALKGLWWNGKAKGKSVVVISAIEHHAILDPAHWLETHESAEVILVPVNVHGVIDLEFLKELISNRGDEIAVISIMHSNNETGVIQPIGEVVSMAGDIPVHTDAVQSFKKVPLSYKELGVTALTLSAAPNWTGRTPSWANLSRSTAQTFSASSQSRWRSTRSSRPQPAGRTSTLISASSRARR